MATVNAFTPSIFGLRQGGSSAAASNFSPFSPDPNYLGDGVKGQDTNTQMQAFSHVPKTYSSWYNPTQDEKVASASGKISPTSLQTIRPPSSSQRYNSLLGEASSTASPFQSSRASSRQDAPIGRPEVSRRSSHNQGQYGGHEHEHDAIQDLNGTLASLDLNNSPAMWKGADGVHTLPSSP